MRRNKKGMEMALTTVIMIVLSISVLTVLVIFFNAQTGFFSRFFKTQSTESNVDAVISACDSLATSQSTYAYCCEKKEIVFGDDNRRNVMMNCSAVGKAAWSSGKVGELDCSGISCAG